MKDFSFLTDKEIIEEAKPKSYREKILLRDLTEKFGELITVQELCDYLKVSKANIYRAIEERKLISYKAGSKILIYTKTVLNHVRGNDYSD